MHRSAGSTCRGNAVSPNLHNSLAPFMDEHGMKGEVLAPAITRRQRKGTAVVPGAAYGARLISGKRESYFLNTLVRIASRPPIPFPDVGHGENGRGIISATHNEDQDKEKDK